MRVRVELLPYTVAPRALVTERPTLLGVLLGAEHGEWFAFAAAGPGAAREWYRDSAEDRPQQVTRRRVINALARALAGADPAPSSR